MREKEAAQWKEKVLLVHHEQRLHLIQLLLSKYVMELVNMQAFLSRIDLAIFLSTSLQSKKPVWHFPAPPRARNIKKVLKNTLA